MNTAASPSANSPTVEAPRAVPWRAAVSRAGSAPWDPLLLAIAGYILTAVGRVHQLFPALGALRPAILTGGLAILLYACDGSERRRLTRAWCPTTRYVLALLAWMTVSAASAIRVGFSVELLLDNFVKTVLMYLVIVAAVRGERDVTRLALAYLAAAAVYAAVVLARFDLGDGDAWRLGRLYYYDANDFATFAVSAMPLALLALHSARRAAGRWLGGAALVVLALALVYSGSRGGFIAAVSMMSFVLFGYRAIALRWRVSGAALVAVVVLATASDQYWRQMTTIASDADYNLTEETGRMQIWRRGIGYMFRYPMFGVGPGNFQAAEGTLAPFAQRQQFGVGVRWNAAHNSFIQAGAELGIPGLLLFVAVIVSAFRALRRVSRAGARVDEPLPELAQALTASLLGFVVGACFLSLAYAEMLFALVALAASVEKVSRP